MNRLGLRPVARHPYATSLRKRILDVTVASAALAVGSPILVATAATCAVVGGRRVVRRVPHVGAGGAIIELPFVRTPGDAATGPTLAGRSIGARLGRTLRALRGHEMLLLWSVIRGDLSMVGPAPREARDIVWADPLHHKVLAAKPGLTGVAQAQRPGGSGAPHGDDPRDGAIRGSRLRLDTYYAEHQSLWLDVRILARTAASILGRSGRRIVQVVAPWMPQGAHSAARRAMAAFAEVLGRMRGRHLFLADLAGVALAAYLAFALRFDDVTLEWIVDGPYLPAAALVLAVRPICHIALGLYHPVWRHASVPELVSIINAVVAGTITAIALFYLALPPLGLSPAEGFPRSFWVLEPLLTVAFVATPRLLIRAATSIGPADGLPRPPRPQRTLLYGAGRVGAMIARSAAREPAAGVDPVGFLDDDPARRGRRVAGLPVYGGVDMLPDAIALTGADVLLITMPAAPGPAIRRVTEAGMAAGLQVRTVPALHELYDGSFDAFRVRRVRVEDLIRRPEVSQLATGVDAIIHDRVVLVTGAGGSIGSELARQVFAMRPRRLVLVDRGESALYAIERELEVRATSSGGGQVDVHLSNVASRGLMTRLIDESRPDVIFHAAAYKHVPLMESHPSEAIQVNVGGTLALIDAAAAAGTTQFVLVSTDKAVLPASVMGASKRLAEWLVADAARRLARPYVAVRFGNVLGSTGSVIPIFQNQIENGQALTITHPEMTRYFMTIAEASSLILEAGALGSPGDVFVLDMGEPVRILDLARDFVRLAGRDPETVPLVFTGLRPGEKLHEQLFYDHESARCTANPKVMLAEGDVPPDDVRARALELLELADGAHDELLRESLFSLVRDRPRGDRRTGEPEAPVAVGPGRDASFTAATTA